MQKINLEPVKSTVRDVFSRFSSRQFSDIDSDSAANVTASAYDTDLAQGKHTWIIVVDCFDVVDLLAKNVGEKGSIDYRILGTKKQSAPEDYTLSDFNIEIKEEETIAASSIASSTPEINNFVKQYHAIAVQAKKTEAAGESAILGLDISCR